MFCRRAESLHNEKADLDGLFIYNNLGPDRRERQIHEKMHDAWREEAQVKNIPCEINPSDRYGKGLEVKLALDFAGLDRWSWSDIDIAVMFAMDREVAPAVEQIIRRANDLDTEVWVAMWAWATKGDGQFLPKNIRPEKYRQLLFDYNDFLQVRDETNYDPRRTAPTAHSASTTKPIMEKEKLQSIREAQAAMKNVTADEEGWVRATDFGQALRGEYPNHPATKKGRFIKWFMQESMEDFFEIDRIDPDRIYIRTRQ